MHIKFNQIRLSNFLSMGNATLDLNAGGYTLVNGINQSPDDNAASNGSGKSTLFDAISYALTGETIRGSKDVVNIHGTDGALVELDFTVDGNEYKIIRTKDHSKYKTNLKFFVNSEDKSGKGIRDTEKILAEYLPDITYTLLSSVIILGQGLPQKFSNNTPSGRKEVLENLSNSDFMITDLKIRVSNRGTQLKTMLREFEDKITDLNARLDITSSQLENAEIELSKLDDKAFEQLSDNLTKEQTNIANHKTAISLYDGQINEKETELNGLVEQLAKASQKHQEDTPG